MLMESRFPIHEPTTDGMTAFQIAAFYGHKDIITLMIEHEEAKGPRQKKKLINLLNHSTQIGALSYAIIADQFEVASCLIANKAMLYYYKSDN